MRPVRLEIQGFTCYREKQEIDFTRLGLFAISGPTGSGKSSLLDAITFALYGKVPRLGGQNLDEFISLGASRASVVLDFDMHGERYRVVRSMPRNGAKRAQIEQITNGTMQALGDGVSEVSEKVRALLGLDYEAFIQSVLLPQGDFAKFLKSNPKDQQKILRDLLRLGIYEKMRDKAAGEAKDLSASIEAARGLLEGPYTQATPAHLALIEAELAEVLQKKENAAGELEARRDILRTVQGHWALLKERQQRCDSLEKLNREQPKIDELKQSIARSKQAAAVIPALDAALTKTKALKILETEVGRLEEKLEAAEDERKRKEVDLQGLEQEALGIPAKHNRINELISIVPVVTEHRSWTDRQKTMLGNLAKSEKAIEDHQDRIAKARTKLEGAKQERERLVQRQSDLRYDLTAHTILKSSQRLGYDLSQARSNESELVQPLETARRQEHRLAREVQSKQLALQAAEENHSAVLKAALAAAADFSEAQNLHRAAALRSTLHSGCTCPVCEQPVVELPVRAVPPDLDRTANAVAVAEAAKNAAVAASGLAGQAVTESKTKAETAAERVRDFEAQLTRATRQIEERLKALTAALYPLECPADSQPEQFVEQQLKMFDRLAQEFRGLEDDLTRLALAHQRLESEFSAAQHELKMAQEASLQLKSEIAEADVKIREFADKIAAVKSADLENERLTLKGEIDRLEVRRREAIELHRKAQSIAHDTERSFAEARIKLATASDQRDQAYHAATAALSSAGFADEAETRGALLPPSTLTVGEARITKFEDEFKQFSARLKELDGQLDGVTIEEADVKGAARAVDEMQSLSSGFENRFGELRGQVKTLKINTEKAELLRIVQGGRLSRHAIVRDLVRDLRSDGFQQYLVQGSFRRLVAGATMRLRQLDDRYELVIWKDQFAVVDHDHGSQTRLADTLSGGETFLVSLALALELSEQVQQAAGAVRLDSLFIDEGFGTLDSETLDTVAEAIESLGKTNRMVGVITHVAELHRRLPRLEVRPTPTGSTVQYVED